jgi:hypothetical protein
VALTPLVADTWLLWHCSFLWHWLLFSLEHCHSDPDPLATCVASCGAGIAVGIVCAENHKFDVALCVGRCRGNRGNRRQELCARNRKFECRVCVLNSSRVWLPES